MLKSKSGFTIVELLIVIVVIGILAAITIVAYNGIQNRASDTSIQSDLTNVAKQLEIQKTTSSNGAYPYGNANFNFTVKLNKGAYAISPDASYNLIVCGDNTTAPTYTALFAISKSGNRFYTRGTSGVKPYTGAAWSGSGDQICTAAMTVLNGVATTSYGTGAGYNVDDTSTGPWRAWAGGN